MIGKGECDNEPRWKLWNPDLKKKKSHQRQWRDKKRLPKWWSENYLGKHSAASSGWTVYYKISSYLVTFLSNLTICTMFSFISLRRKKKLQKILPELLCERKLSCCIHSLILHQFLIRFVLGAQIATWPWEGHLKPKLWGVFNRQNEENNDCPPPEMPGERNQIIHGKYLAWSSKYS